MAHQVPTAVEIQTRPSPPSRPHARLPKCRDPHNLPTSIRISAHQIPIPMATRKRRLALSHLNIPRFRRPANTIQMLTPDGNYARNTLEGILRIMWSTSLSRPLTSIEVQSWNISILSQSLGMSICLPS